MKSILSDQVASFRYGLIAPIVCRQTPLLPGELKAYLEETASQIYETRAALETKLAHERWSGICHYTGKADMMP